MHTQFNIGRDNTLAKEMYRAWLESNRRYRLEGLYEQYPARYSEMAFNYLPWYREQALRREVK